MQVLDILGQEIEPGDRIAGAFRSSVRAELRTGTVLGFSERGNKLTVTVKWDTSSSGLNYGDAPLPVNIVGNIEADLRRFIRIG